QTPMGGIMWRHAWPIVLALVALSLTSVLLSGCGRKPAPAGATVGAAGAAGAGAGGSGGPGARSGTGSGRGEGGAAGAPGRAAGGAGMAGTTLPALPSPSAFGEITALRDVHFEFDRYTIRRQDGRALEDNARWLKANPRALLLIEGHADERGTNEYNIALGERRATAARDYLVTLGIDRARITLLSYGEERPLCSERTESCWAQNRRAHFLVRQ